MVIVFNGSLLLSNLKVKAYRGICDQCTGESGGVTAKIVEVLLNEANNSAELAVKSCICTGSHPEHNIWQKRRLLVNASFLATRPFNAA